MTVFVALRMTLLLSVIVTSKEYVDAVSWSSSMATMPALLSSWTKLVSESVVNLPRIVFDLRKVTGLPLSCVHR
jgi:hypothetical protein